MINSNLVYGLDLCVVGSSGGLRELIYQGINNIKKLALLIIQIILNYLIEVVD